MTRVVNSTMSFYHFVDPDLVVKICFETEGATEKGGIKFRGLKHPLHTYGV